MLHLQEMAKQGQQTQLYTLDDRLPVFLTIPCQLTATYHVEAEDDFYLIHLETESNLSIICQRCMQHFNYSYHNKTIIAVCRSEQRAEELLESYECIVASNWQVDLAEIIIDELHLYAPQFHPDINDCDSGINEFLTEKIDTY